MKILEGDIFEFAQSGKFDVIVQGNNCFSTQGAGIAVEFVKRYSTLDFNMELPEYPLNQDENTRFNKLGCIDYQYNEKHGLFVVNCYSQFYPGKDARLWAVASCFRKINHVFKGDKVLMPALGCGIGSLEPKLVQNIVNYVAPDVQVYWVNYKQ